MAKDQTNRRLAAILAADVVGYSRMMGADEGGTLTALKHHRETVFNPAVAEHKGRIVKLIGDGTLVEFGSVVDAVKCALDIQRAIKTEAQPSGRSIVLRIGINLGDVIIDGDDIYGDGVNVAMRLEPLAPPGGVCVAAIVNESVGNRIDVHFTDGGEVTVKNIERPVRVWKWHPGSDPVSDRPAPVLATPGRTQSESPSIAVLPFNNMSGDPEQEYFSDGITDDIITALSRFRWFLIIARSSTFVYKGHGADVKQVGRDLAARYVLEGSVRRSGQRVRITAQLIDAASGGHIWAEQYDRELTDIFAVQDEITARVAAAIQPKLWAAEDLRGGKRSTDDLDAWDLVAHAMSHQWKLTPADSKTAISILQQAVQRHPDYAPARGLLAYVLALSASIGWMPAGRDDELVAELAARAIDLDPDDSWPHEALGQLAVSRRQTDDAVRHYQTALDLNPNLPTAHCNLGWALILGGRSEQALGCFERSRTLRTSPRDPWTTFDLGGIAAAHYFAARYAEAVKWARQSAQVRSGLLTGQRFLCAGLAQMGQNEEAKAVMGDLLQLQPDMSAAWMRSLPYTPGPLEHLLQGLRKAGLPD